MEALSMNLSKIYHTNILGPIQAPLLVLEFGVKFAYVCFRLRDWHFQMLRSTSVSGSPARATRLFMPHA